MGVVAVAGIVVAFATLDISLAMNPELALGVTLFVVIVSEVTLPDSAVSVEVNKDLSVFDVVVGDVKRDMSEVLESTVDIIDVKLLPKSASVAIEVTSRVLYLRGLSIVIRGLVGV